MIILNRLKILQIVKGIDIGGNSGGAESFGVRLALSLHEHGLDVYVCAYVNYDTPVEKYWQNQLENAGIKVFFASTDRKFHPYKAQKRIKNWLKDHPIDIVHSHYQVGTITSIYLKSKHRYRFLVRTSHIDSEFGSTIYGVFSRLIFREIVYPIFMDCEIGVSRAITQNLNQQIIRSLLHKPAFWIPNAIPDRVDLFFPEEQPALNLDAKSDEDWIVTTIGLLVTRKKIDILIRSMVEVVKQIPHAKLVIVGEGPELNDLIGLSKELGISKSCWFLGQQQNIHAILKKSNIFTLPSSSEGFSTVILEAMQNKVPVIASDIPGNRELIEDGRSGWLVPVGNVDALTSAIIRSYQHPDENFRMAEQAYTQLDEYSMSTVCSKYLKIFFSLMQTK